MYYYQAFGQIGLAEEASKCLDAMELEGLRPNVISYSAAISACRSKPDIVLRILERMTDRDGKHGGSVKSNTVLLTSAMDSLARAGGKYSGQDMIIISIIFLDILRLIKIFMF